MGFLFFCVVDVSDYGALLSDACWDEYSYVFDYFHVYPLRTHTGISAWVGWSGWMEMIMTWVLVVCGISLHIYMVCPEIPRQKNFWHVINDKWWGQGRGNTGGYICFPQFIHNTGVYSSGSAGIGVLWVLVRLRRYPYLSLCPPVALGLYRSPLLSPLPRCLGWHILHFRSVGNTGRVYKFHIVPV